jgi:hypothetical protein
MNTITAVDAGGHRPPAETDDFSAKQDARDFRSFKRYAKRHPQEARRLLRRLAKIAAGKVNDTKPQRY